MEKGFNDDELADIMNEIESLEQEFTEEVAQESAVDEAPQQQAAQEEEPVAQEEPQEEVQPEAPAAPQHQEQPAAQADEEMNEVLDELSQMPVEDVVPVNNEKPEENIHHIKEVAPAVSHGQAHHHPSGAHSSMSFTVSGDMTVDLSFNVGGNVVSIQVNEQEGLVIGMEGGAKFSVPLQSNAVKKAS
jgi:hypothetical protein